MEVVWGLGVARFQRAEFTRAIVVPGCAARPWAMEYNRVAVREIVQMALHDPASSGYCQTRRLLDLIGALH